MKYRVMRQHFGDRLYQAGDEREASEGDVAHLVANGVLELIQVKAEPALANKAEPALRNKAAK